MKDNSDLNSGPLRKRDEISQDEYYYREDRARQSRSSSEEARPKSITAWTFIDLFAARWYWVVLAGLLFSVAFFYLGSKVVQPKYTATAQMLRFETPMSDYFKTPPVTAETFSGLIRNPELLQKVADRAQKEHGVPALPPEKLTKIIKIDPEPDSDMMKISLAQQTPEQAVALLNIYVEEAANYTRSLQQQQARQLATEYLKAQVERMETNITALHREFRNMPAAGVLTNQLGEVSRSLSAVSGGISGTTSPFIVAEQTRRLQSSIAELNDLLARYTDLHPAVIAKRDEIATIEKGIQKGATNNVGSGISSASMAAMMSTAPTRPGEAPFNPELDIVRTKLLSLEQGRVELANRYYEAELFAQNPPGVAKVFAPANLKTTQSNMRWAKVGAVAIVGGMLGVFFSICLVLLIEFIDSRLKTEEDLRRVTRLPVLTSLGDLHKMTPEERSRWAFRTWTLMQGRLSPSANHGLVCGITSSTKGEGRTTWIRLLAEAASLTGFRVLTIATRPSPPQTSTHTGNGKSAEAPASREEKPMNGSNTTPEQTHATGGAAATGSRSSGALTTNVLTSPMQVTEQLTGPNSQPMVHIPLPGWVWNLERRKQWGEALGHWRQIDNLVILVELPPASVPEAVLLGSNLPNMVWLSDSGKADAAETRAQLQTLRDARCNLVGAVLNRAGAQSLKNRFSRWMTCLIAAGLVCSVSSVQAQTNTNGAAAGAALAPVSQAQAQPSPLPGTANANANADANTNSNSATSASQDAVLSTSAPATANAGAAAEDALENNGRRGSFSIVKPTQKAAWQQRLTLGPGDVLMLGLYGFPELNKAEVTVGPDGRISYLEAQDVLAQGLTIDELRKTLDDALGKYRRAPRTMVTPVTFKSKKFFILGKVMTKGVYTLDRPMTVLEAIARAKGLENGLVDRNIVEIADVQRAFLARGGKRIPLDFEKLFAEGDLSQNIPIEPDDYIYFPPADIKEVYVVGEVRSPGAVTYTPNLTIIGAISARAGYTDRAYKMRVLVVRGSVNNPESIVVDTHAILDGNKKDFKVQPKDIIYINSRPFIRVEELADMAATAFLQSLITSWVGVDVLSPISN